MALAKLWTALFGKRDEGKQEAPSGAVSPVAKNAASVSETESSKSPAAVMPPTVNAKSNVAETRVPRLAATAKGKGPAAERAVHRPATTESKGKAKKKSRRCCNSARNRGCARTARQAISASQYSLDEAFGNCRSHIDTGSLHRR